MITSILDTDLYKFSTSYAYFSLYPNAEGTFEFKDRNCEDWTSHPEFMKHMRNAVDVLRTFQLRKQELDWCISNIPYIPSNYWEWLSSFRFEPKKVQMWIGNSGEFHCTVTDKLYKATLYEIAILATYSEVRNTLLYGCGHVSEAVEKFRSKLPLIKESGIRFSEFGTRRRFSSYVQGEVIDEIKRNSDSINCLGTSNVMFAMKYGMKPMGTFPHEWIMFHGAVFGYKRANYLGIEDWIKVYDGELGIALVDTYTTKSFLETLTKKHALLLSGFRQDSGDESEITDMLVARLKELGIDPKTKGIVYSNALDFEKAERLYNENGDKMNVSFGIGTNLTCDVGIDGFRAPNIVMKLMRCRMSSNDEWEQCIKLSDDPGKFMGDEKEKEIAEYELFK